IGLALVSVVAVLGQGPRPAPETAGEKQGHSEDVLTSEDGWGPFTVRASDAPAGAPGDAGGTSVPGDRGKGGAKRHDANRGDPATIGKGYTFEWSTGWDATLARLGSNGAIVKKKLADDRKLTVGEHFALVTPEGKSVSLVVRGIYDPPKLDS